MTAPLILGTNSIKDEGYEVANSLRFNKGSSDYLNRTFGTSTSTKKCTYSCWVKRSKLNDSGGQYLFTFNNTGSAIYFNGSGTGAGTNDELVINSDSNFAFYTDDLYRDVSAWYHIVVAVDTTQGTASNRVKIYVNNVQVTNFGTETYPSQNADFNNLFSSSGVHEIGRGSATGGTEYFGGYMAEVVFIDGQQLDPTSFGEFDSDTGIWKPIDVSDLTFGNNGFYLDFENSGSLGADVSGNGNNFTVNNLTSIDQSTDTCTNNFANISPIDIPTNSSGSSGTLPTLSNGNLSVVNTNSAFREARSTYYLTTGKWYWETKMTRLSNTLQVGVVLNNYSAGSGERRMYQNNGFKYISSSSSYGATYTTNDIIGVALNLDDGEITFYKNGASQGVAVTDLLSGMDDTGWTPAVNCFDADCDFNFGSPPYSISSGNSDGNGYGNFEYSVPSGYYALCTKNLAEYG